MDSSRTAIITATWGGDLEHFRTMRASLERSSLAVLDHYVVVQDEDLHLFHEFRNIPSLKLLSTKDVLPIGVEKRRKKAKRISDNYGRRFAKLCGSLKRKFGWPVWPSYTGWHTQQLCKLSLASTVDCDNALILDSDVIVTPAACASDFDSSEGIFCFAQWQERNTLKGKVLNWITESERLVGVDVPINSVNVYFDTPFVFDRAVLQSALNSLEERSGVKWWQAFLNCPPRRWSEFGFYKAFLSYRHEGSTVDWRDPDNCHYIYDTSDPKHVVDQVQSMMNDQTIHYITVHSQSSGRENWDPGHYLTPLQDMIKKQRAVN